GWESIRLARRTPSIDLPPAFDVDEELVRYGAGAHPTGRRRPTRHDPHAAADADTVRSHLSLLCQAGEHDHRAFLRLDLRHHLLRAVHAEVHAFGHVDAARLILRALGRGEDLTFRAAGDRHAHRVFGYRLGFLCGRGRGDKHDHDDNHGFHDGTPLRSNPGGAETVSILSMNHT